MTATRLPEALLGGILLAAVSVTVLFTYSLIYLASPHSRLFVAVVGGATWLWGMFPFFILGLLVRFVGRTSMRLDSLPLIFTVCGVCLLELYSMGDFVRYGGSFLPGALLFLPLLSLLCIPVLYGFTYLICRIYKLLQRSA